MLRSLVLERMNLLPLIGTEGLIIFMVIVLVSLIAVRMLAPYSVHTEVPLGLAAAEDDRPQPKRVTATRRVVRKSSGFRLPVVSALPVDRAQIAAAKYRQAALGAIDRGAAFAGKARGSVRAFLNGAAEKKGAYRRASVRPMFAMSAEKQNLDEAATSVVRDAHDELHLDGDVQWDRLNDFVAEGIARTQQVEDLHDAAARQLDAVDYAYERMLLELSEVLPGVVGAQETCRSNRDEAYGVAQSSGEVTGSEPLSRAAAAATENSGSALATDRHAEPVRSSSSEPVAA